jgi:hypothetical protein
VQEDAMTISSVVAVAELPWQREAINSIDLSFGPRDSYPAVRPVHLEIRDQPIPAGPPTRVVPAITGVWLSYGTSSNRLNDAPDPAFEPAEHWLRELLFYAFFDRGDPMAPNYRAVGDWASVTVGIGAGLRDNSPPGLDSEADDAFVAHVTVKALCIWTQETPALLDWIRGNVVRPFSGRQDPRTQAPHK